MMLLELRNIKKSYGKNTVLDDVSFTLEKGCYFLLGPNGAGKSTLINIIVGLIAPDDGDILVDGITVKKTGDSYLEKIGYSPQFPQFYPNYTVFELLEYVSLIKGNQKSADAGKIKQVIELVNLSDKADEKIKTLSGGMKQRLGIAEALIGEPELVILDEPSAGLDFLEQKRFKRIIADIAKDRTVLVTTHIISDVENMNSRLLFLKKGKIYPVEWEDGRIEDLYVDFFEEKK